MVCSQMRKSREDGYFFTGSKAACERRFLLFSRLSTPFFIGSA